MLFRSRFSRQESKQKAHELMVTKQKKANRGKGGLPLKMKRGLDLVSLVTFGFD